MPFNEPAHESDIKNGTTPAIGPNKRFAKSTAIASEAATSLIGRTIKYDIATNT